MGVGIALASTVIPAAAAVAEDVDGPVGTLALYSWIVGPFPGLVYAGKTMRGLMGAGIRTGMLALELRGVASVP